MQAFRIGWRQEKEGNWLPDEIKLMNSQLKKTTKRVATEYGKFG